MKQVALHLDISNTEDLDNARVVRIDAVEINNGKIGKQHLNEIINPDGARISKKVSKYHGLSNNQKRVKEARTFAEVATQLLPMIRDAEVILQVAMTHHVLNLELDRLETEHLKDQASSVKYTFQMFRQLHSKDEAPKVDLGSIAKFYNVEEKSEGLKIAKVVQAMAKEKADKVAKKAAEVAKKDTASAAGMFASSSRALSPAPVSSLMELDSPRPASPASP